MNRSSSIQQLSNVEQLGPTVSQQASPSVGPVEQNTITLTAAGFSPGTLTINVGDKVVWINESGIDATVSSNPHPTHTDYPPLNLGSFPNGGTLSLTFDKVGAFGYHNHLNPNQSGTIVVQ